MSYGKEKELINEQEEPGTRRTEARTNAPGPSNEEMLYSGTHRPFGSLSLDQAILRSSQARKLARYMRLTQQNFFMADFYQNELGHFDFVRRTIFSNQSSLQYKLWSTNWQLENKLWPSRLN